MWQQRNGWNYLLDFRDHIQYQYLDEELRIDQTFSKYLFPFSNHLLKSHPSGGHIWFRHYNDQTFEHITHLEIPFLAVIDHGSQEDIPHTKNPSSPTSSPFVGHNRCCVYYVCTKTNHYQKQCSFPACPVCNMLALGRAVKRLVF